MLNEREALRFMARLWKGACQDNLSEATYTRTISGSRASGLCLTINHLIVYGLISDRTARRLQILIQANRPKTTKTRPYFWPRDLTGAKRRATFCERLAER